MVNRVSSYFPKDGHSAAETELKNVNIRKVKRHRNSDTRVRIRSGPKHSSAFPIAKMLRVKLGVRDIHKMEIYENAQPSSKAHAVPIF